MSSNLWNDAELRKCLKLLRASEQARRKKVDLVRGRIKSGFYLTDDVALATAREMLARRPELRG